MSGSPALRYAKAVRIGQERQNFPVPLMEAASHAPRSHREDGSLIRPSDPSVVVGPDRIGNRWQRSGIFGSVRKKIRQQHASIAPRLRKANTTPYRRVIGGLIRGGWIQSNDHDNRLVRVP